MTDLGRVVSAASKSGDQSVKLRTSSVAETFSITRGGPLHWLLVRLGQAADGRRLVLRRALAVGSDHVASSSSLFADAGDGLGKSDQNPFPSRSCHLKPGFSNSSWGTGTHGTGSGCQICTYMRGESS